MTIGSSLSPQPGAMEAACSSHPAAKKRVLIVGAGFGGLYAARALRSADVEIVVVDKRNHHLFQPLLYQVATAALNPSDIASPIRSILHSQKNASVILGEVVDIDVARRVVMLSDGELTYDWLIVAAGATDNYFGHDSWRPPAPGLKTLEDAVELRRRMLFAFEAAERATDRVEQQAWLTFVVVGGGPTGVEMAGALAEVAHTTLARDFRHIDPHRTRIIVVEAGKLLSTYPPSLQDRRSGLQPGGHGVGCISASGCRHRRSRRGHRRRAHRSPHSHVGGRRAGVGARRQAGGPRRSRRPRLGDAVLAAAGSRRGFRGRRSGVARHRR